LPRSGLKITLPETFPIYLLPMVLSTLFSDVWSTWRMFNVTPHRKFARLRIFRRSCSRAGRGCVQFGHGILTAGSEVFQINVRRIIEECQIANEATKVKTRPSDHIKLIDAICDGTFDEAADARREHITRNGKRTRQHVAEWLESDWSSRSCRRVPQSTPQPYFPFCIDGAATLAIGLSTQLHPSIKQRVAQLTHAPTSQCASSLLPCQH